MFLLSPAWKKEAGLPTKVEILGIWDTVVPDIGGTETDPFVPSHPDMGKRNQF